MRTGRPAGRVDHCKICGEPGHRSRNGECSPAAEGERLVRELGLSGRHAARALGMSESAINKRIAERGRLARRQIEEHW